MAKTKQNKTQASTTTTHHPTTIKNKEPNKKNKTNEDEKPWSKSKKKRMRKLLNSQHSETDTNSSRPNTSLHSQKSKPRKKKKLPKAISSETIRNKSNDSANDVIPSTDGSQWQQPAIVRDDVNNDIVLMMGNRNKPQSSLQQAFHARLAGSRFRELNEELYTTTSSSAHQRFKDNPELFDQYHQGFRTQVKSWPVNPVDIILRWLISLQKKRASGTIGNGGGKRKMKRKGATKKSLSVADFGCGDAMLGKKLLDYQKKNSTKGDEGAANNGKIHNEKTGPLPFSVHSFDLVSNGNPLITPCDMSNVPLKDGSIDVGIFSLALMGTNIADFIREAHRVLTPAGILKIAEVRSRFETTATITEEEEDVGSGPNRNDDGRQHHSVAPSFSSKRDPERRTFDQTLLKDFLCVMRELGFYCKETDRSNTMFFLLEFKKTGANPCQEATFTAKPCLYKRR